MGYLIYGIGFFVIILLIQYIVYIIRKDPAKKLSFWTGTTCVICLCVLGIVNQDIHYFASVIGFVMGDSVGETMKWH